MSLDGSVSELRDSITEQGKILKLPTISDVVRRDCVLLILRSMMDFLKAWPREKEKEIPEVMLREGLALVLSEIGPGDSQLRCALLDTFQATSSGRQQLMDVLPYTMPLNEDEWDDASEKVLQAFRNVLSKDSSSLVPIIGSLSSLPLSNKARKEAWKLALISLPVLDTTDLPTAVKSLLRNVTSTEEGVEAIQSIRVLTNDLVLIASIVLEEFRHLESGPILRESSLQILGKNASSQGKGDFVMLPFDFILLLDHYQHISSRSRIENFLDEMVQNGFFPFEQISKVLSMIHPKHKSLYQENLQSSLLAIGLFLLLSPIRLPVRDAKIVLSQTQDFISKLHSNLDRNRQEELVRSLMNLGDEISSITPGKKRGRTLNVASDLDIKEMSQAMHTLLLSLATKNPLSLAKFKFMFVERLTSEKIISGYEESCALLVTLFDSGLDGVMDSTELMMLLQKLLFTSSFVTMQCLGHQNLSKPTRGMALATCMINSKVISVNNKECIYNWALKILLPANRRTVHPSMGLQGLFFLAAWANQSMNNQRDVFQRVRMIMANTGLVQIKEAYLQRKKQGVDLAYQDTPSCFMGNTTRRKSRDLMFCVATYFNYRGHIQPKEWSNEISWIFNLVDTYLQQGRKDVNVIKQTKWLPDGWLKACIEIPSFDLCSKDKKVDIVFSTLMSYSLGEIAKVRNDLYRRRTYLLSMDDFLSSQEQVENIVHLAISLLLSTGISVAVLQNSFDHSQKFDTSGDQASRNNEVKGLLKYQLLKIYDLFDRIEVIQNILESFSFFAKRCNSKERKVSKYFSSDDLLDEIVNHIRSNVSWLHKLPIFSEAKLLKTCVVDESDTSLILQGNITHQHHIDMIILLRLRVLDHSVLLFEARNNLSRFDPIILSNVGDTVSRLVQRLDTTSGMNSSLIRLLSSYIEYIICVLDDILDDTKVDKTLAITLMKCMNIENGISSDLPAKHADKLFEKFYAILPRLKDFSLALQFVEVLSFIASFNLESLLGRTLDACWKVLHTVYSFESISLKRDVSAFFSRISKFLSVRELSSKALRQSIIKFSNSHPKEYLSFPEVKRGILLLWSLLVHPNNRHFKEGPMISSIIDDIELYLKGKNGQDAKENMKSKNKRKFTMSSIPSLNGATLLLYFEITIQLIIGTFAVLPPARPFDDSNPYRHFIVMAHLFGRLLELYEEYSSIFPKRFLALMITSCRNLLDISISKTHACLDWRNSQPLLTTEERQAGRKDYASILFLQEYLQTMCSLTCGTVVSFCIRARGRDGEHITDRRVTHLLNNAQRTANSLRRISLAHNIILPNGVFDENLDPMEAENIDITGFNKFGIISFDDDDDASQLRKKQRKAADTSLPNRDTKDDIAFELEDTEDESSTIGFAAVGDWGSEGSDFIDDGLSLKLMTDSKGMFTT
jgi:hypothetical protein